MPNLSLDNVTLALLAGGAGSRMGHAKGLLDVRGTPILHYLLDRLAWPGPTLLVTAPGREHPPGWERFDREASDPVPGEGPLRGVLTALEHSTTNITVIAAVDMPAVMRTELAWFANQLNDHPSLLGVMGTKCVGEIEPLPCALRPGARIPISDSLASGRRSLHGLTRDARVGLVDAGGLPARSWLNVNTPGEWELFLRDLPE